MIEFVEALRCDKRVVLTQLFLFFLFRGNNQNTNAKPPLHCRHFIHWPVLLCSCSSPILVATDSFDLSTQSIRHNKAKTVVDKTRSIWETK